MFGITNELSASMAAIFLPKCFVTDELKLYKESYLEAFDVQPLISKGNGMYKVCHFKEVPFFAVFLKECPRYCKLIML